MGFGVQDIAQWIQGRVVNSDALGSLLNSIQIETAAPLALAREKDVAFFFSREYEKELFSAAPGVLVTGEPFVLPLQAAKLPFWTKTVVIACRDPYLGMALISEKLAAKLSTAAHLVRPEKSEIHPSAVIHPTAEIGQQVMIGAFAVIEARARIGNGTVIYPHVWVGPGASLGEDCAIFPGVKIYEWTQIGNRVRIHANSTVGSDGFGYAPIKNPESKLIEGHQKIYHLGRVRIEDDVSIGANSSVDRATFGETVLSRNVKIDNQVQVGHNAQLEEGAVLCGGTCIAGSARIGKYAYILGLTGVTNRVHVGDRATVAAMSLISKDIPAGGKAVGSPQRTHQEHFRVHAWLNKQLSAHQKKPHQKKGNKDEL